MGTGIFQKIRFITKSLCSVIYGKNEVCLLCESPQEEGYICETCSMQIKVLNLQYDIENHGIKFPCCSLGVYSFNFKKLILLLKYEKEFVAGEILASYLSTFIEANLKEKIDMITFIPSSKTALKTRGFNQCEILCKYVSERCGIPYMPLMDKRSEGRDQIGLDTGKRWENVKDSFQLKSTVKIENKRILLIDDVVTSGATSFHGAKCLKDGGAGEVYILTVAKSGV